MVYPRQTNIFYDNYETVLDKYKECGKEVWEDKLVVTLIDTPDTIGCYSHSDLILYFADRESPPLVVSERVFKKNYSRRVWFYMKKARRAQVRGEQSIGSYRLAVSFGIGYMDCIYIMKGPKDESD